MCKICDILNVAEETPTPFDENDLNKVTNGIWIGYITIHQPPLDVYKKTYNFLNDGITLGFNIQDDILLNELQTNIYLFSAAKTYQETKAMSTLLEIPELKSNFYKFKEQASKIFNDYNQDYLQSEYQTSIASARMAADWQRYEQEADVLPLLQYQTVGDARVRPTHQALDNIIRPINDKFWSNYYPPNGWRCRCTVQQLAEGEITNLQGWLKPDDVPPEFMMNSGKDKYIFKERGKGKHPYFVVPKEDKDLAKNNFNLPIPDGKAK